MSVGHDILDEVRDPVVRATSLIDNWDSGGASLKKMVEDEWKLVQGAFGRAEKELKGLRRSGAGDTESPALLKAHVLKPMRRFANLIDRAARQVEEVAK